MADYNILLKDPRWQRKRLTIFNRDAFSCQYCGSTTATLNVHHIRYEDGPPWDVPDECLITFCEKCHEIETNLGKQNPTLSLYARKYLVPVLFQLELLGRHLRSPFRQPIGWWIDTKNRLFNNENIKRNA